MHAFASITATVALFLGLVHSSPIENRQVIYGCYFNGDGIVNAYVSVGHDMDFTGASGQSHLLDCGTTSNQFVPGVFAKCTVDGVQPFISAIPGDSVNINCSF